MEELQRLIREECVPVVRRSGVPAGERERLLQDVLVSVWEFARGQNEPPRNFRAFLQWRARGTLSAFRRELLPSTRHEETLDIELADVCIRLGDPVVLREVSQAFRDCRERLTPLYADVWNERFEKRRSPLETSKSLGISVENVAVRLHRAKDQLLDCLTKKGVFS